MFGFTPLHIAVTSAEKLGSTRNVKALLLRGASRDTKDKKGRKPIDIIPQHIDEKLAMDLKDHLGPQIYYECLMLRGPLIPLKKNHET